MTSNLKEIEEISVNKSHSEEGKEMMADRDSVASDADDDQESVLAMRRRNTATRNKSNSTISDNEREKRRRSRKIDSYMSTAGGSTTGSPADAMAGDRKSRTMSRIIVPKRESAPLPPKYLPFREIRKFPSDTQLCYLLKYAGGMLKEGIPTAAVAQPTEISTNEWLEVNAYLYFNRVNNYFGYLKDHCKCERMTIGTKYEFLWADGKTIRKPINIPAQDYVEYLMAWIEANFDDKRLFPDYDNAKHHHGFTDAIKCIFKRLFRVLGHMQTVHKDAFELEEGMAEELEMTFKCFVEFVKTFKLMDKKSLNPCHDLISKWKAEKKQSIK